MDFILLGLGMGLMCICFSIADYIEAKARTIADRKKGNDHE